MGKYIGIRLAHALVILAIVIVLVFVIARLIPGDAIMAAMAGSVDLHDPSVVTRVRHQYGLDEPILVQFAVWLKRFVRGDWGISIGTGENVLDMFLRRLPVTLELFVGAYAVVGGDRHSGRHHRGAEAKFHRRYDCNSRRHRRRVDTVHSGKRSS